MLIHPRPSLSENSQDRLYKFTNGKIYVINKENKNTTPPSKNNQGAADLARGRADAHLIIRDRDTQKIIVNQRG